VENSQAGWGSSSEKTFDLREFRSTNPAVKSAPQVVLGAKSSIAGNIKLEGTSQIDGTVEGEIQSSGGDLIIGESGSIKAKIVATSAKVFGKVIGDIDCSERLELRKGAQVTGNITARSLVIEDGVVFQGYCTMQRTSSFEIEKIVAPSKTTENLDQSGEPVLELTAAVAPSTVS
jgi:cytoskeletal protein CcmA (bactofilin family)